MAEAFSNVLADKRIVVTRAPEQSISLMNVLRKAGADPVSLPLVAFAPPENLASLDEAIRNARQHDWLFLTSQNAVTALKESCARLGVNPKDATSGCSVAVVGPATAEAVRRAGMDVTHVSVKRDGVALATELAERIKGKSVLLPRSDLANVALVEILRKSGADITEVVAYRTIRPLNLEPAVRQLMRSALPDAILFFSPSAVRHLRESLTLDEFYRLARSASFCAIGPVTEQALRKSGVEQIVAAEDTTSEGILSALTHYFGGVHVGPASRMPSGAKRG